MDPAAAQSQAMQNANSAATGAAEPKGPSPAAKAIADKVPRTEQGVEAYMDHKDNFGDILVKYKGREHYVDPELDPLLAKADALATEADAYYARQEKPPPDLVKLAKTNLHKASGKAERKKPTEFEELRGVYKAMSGVVVPKWQQELDAASLDRDEL